MTAAPKYSNFPTPPFLAYSTAVTAAEATAVTSPSLYPQPFAALADQHIKHRPGDWPQQLWR